MSGLGQRLKQRREELGLSLPALAKKVGGITYQTIQAVEKGGQTRHVVSLARALGVDPHWLETGEGVKETVPKAEAAQQASINQHMRDTRAGSSAAPDHNVTNVGPDYMRVLGMAEGGPDGWNLWNGETVEFMRRPDNLLGVPNAYAVYVTGNSMEPRYRQGEKVHVHPAKPVNPGDYVLVQRKPADGETPLAVIKLLVRRTATKLILRQHNPDKEIEVKTADVVSIHRVVGSSEA